jgi:hypothetical protein
MPLELKAGNRLNVKQIWIDQPVMDERAPAINGFPATAASEPSVARPRPAMTERGVSAGTGWIGRASPASPFETRSISRSR